MWLVFTFWRTYQSCQLKDRLAAPVLLESCWFSQQCRGCFHLSWSTSRRQPFPCPGLRVNCTCRGKSANQNISVCNIYMRKRACNNFSVPDGDNVREKYNKSEKVTEPRTHKSLQCYHDNWQNHLSKKQGLGEAIQLQVQKANLQ